MLQELPLKTGFLAGSFADDQRKQALSHKANPLSLQASGDGRDKTRTRQLRDDLHIATLSSTWVSQPICDFFYLGCIFFIHSGTDAPGTLSMAGM